MTSRMNLVIRLWSVTTVAGDRKVKLATFQRTAKNDSKKRQDKSQEQKERGKDVNHQHRKDPRTWLGQMCMNKKEGRGKIRTTSSQLSHPGGAWVEGGWPSGLKWLVTRGGGLLPWDPLVVATTSPDQISQTQLLVFLVGGCRPRLLNSIDGLHKAVVVTVEPTGVSGKKGQSFRCSLLW